MKDAMALMGPINGLTRRFVDISATPVRSRRRQGFVTRPLFRLAIGIAIGIAVATGAPASDSTERLDRFKTLSLEDLINMEVSIASKTPQRLGDVAAAVFVITDKDIKRSGATSIPDVLRMVPGVYVGRIDSNKWSISARGLPGRFANKLLVLVDGRSVYSPIFSGVFWDIQDTLLDDVDRIEVIRGPGAAVWGANAVNGVINIITKNAADTQGGLAKATAGTEIGQVALRYGGKTENGGHYRAFAKYRDLDGGELSSGNSPDDWEDWRAGFRFDTDRAEVGTFALIGNAFTTDSDQRITVPDLISVPISSTTFDETAEKSGFNLLGRWNRDSAGGGESTLQVYVDHLRYEETLIEDEQWTFDIDFQHSVPRFGRHELTWGLGYRAVVDEIEPNTLVIFDPLDRTDHLFSAFIQDQAHLFDDRMLLTVGLKVEHNDYTGFEFQPSVRALWRQKSGASWWASVSRAVRVPARAEHDTTTNQLVVPADLTASPPRPFPTLVQVQTSDRFDSEELLAYEIGYRNQVSKNFRFDAAVYLHDFDEFTARELQAPLPVGGFPPSYILQPVDNSNGDDGKVYGLELAADWRPVDRLRIQPAYTFTELDFPNPGLDDSTPQHQLSIRGSIDLSEDKELDLWLRHVDEIENSGIDAYTEMDVRLGWQVSPKVLVELVGRNLFDDSHPESIPEDISTTPTEVEREFYLQTRIQF